jgi:cytochrome c-type biogenesis protein CcmF
VARVSAVLALPAGVSVLAAILFAVNGVTSIMPLIALSLAPGLAVASVLPLRGRNLRRAPLSLWGMVVAHVGIAVALFGMGADSAFSQERLIAAHIGEATQVGPWRITLRRVEPVAGPNWTALEADLVASYQGGAPVELHPQSRTFWAPVQTTSVSALHTVWNGQLYTVLGEESREASGAPTPLGRWQLRLWWKPFVPLLWLGGVLVALGGVLAMFSRIRQDLKRRSVRLRSRERKA